MPEKHKKKQVIKARGISPKLAVALAVAFFVGVALFLRIALPYDDIFTAYGVKFNGNDAYYYMRLVDNMTHNFPHLMPFDPYLVYSNLSPIGLYYLWARMLASISWLVGLGSPSQYLIDAVSAFMPAILGALVVLPVYFIGRGLSDKWGGIISAGLIAIVSGEFLGRSLLGFADHHIAEVLFSTVFMLFFMLAVLSGKARHMEFGNIRSEKNIRPIGYSVLAGIFLGLYLLTWQGGLLFAFIISIFLVAQFIVRHLRGQSTDYLCIVGVCSLGVGALMFIPSIFNSSYVLLNMMPMIVAVLLPIVLSALSCGVRRWNKPAFYYPLSIAGLGMISMAVLYLASPSMAKSVLNLFLLVFVPTGTKVTTSEMTSLLFPFGTFTLSVIWSSFGLAFFVGLISLGLLVRGWFKDGHDEKLLVSIWALVMLAMALGQRRFGYYLAVDVALLAGYMGWVLIRWAGTGSAVLRRSVWRGVNVALVVLVVGFAFYLPIIPNALYVAKASYYIPSDAWCDALTWLRSNSPEPFGNADAYWEDPRVYAADGNSAYAVLSWWDYGYWITRIGHRVPNVTPGQDPVVQAAVAGYFVSQGSKDAERIAQDLGAKYVIIDSDMVTGKFWAIARYAGKDESDYFGIYYVLNGSQLMPVQLYYPDYYRSLAVRLYSFDGQAVAPDVAMVISYEPRMGSNGENILLITNVKYYKKYTEAETFVSDQTIGNWRIASSNPFVTPVPLDAVQDYQLAYCSSQYKSFNDMQVPAVKIFEHIG